MRSWQSSAAVVAAALALVASTWVTDGTDPEARRPAERPPRPEPRPTTDRPSVYVDVGSLGGRCDDRRTLREAASPRTPVCSLAGALAIAPAGAVVRVLGGPYPDLQLREEAPLASGVAVVGAGTARPVIGRIEIAAADGLRLQRLDAAAIVLGGGVRDAQVLDSVVAEGIVLDEGASDVLIAANDITAPRSTGVFFSSSAGKPAIERVTIRGNRIHDLGVAGISARNFRDVLVEGNEITRVVPWRAGQHTDVVRTFAGGRGLVIRNNVLHDNTAIGIFTKDGPVRDLRIENNVILRTRRHHAISLYDAHRVTLANNTVAGNQFGVVLRRDTTGVTSINNIFQSLTAERGMTYARNERNLVGGVQSAHFSAPSRLDYRLARTSPAIDAGTSLGAPRRDTEGRYRVDVRARRNRGAGRVRYVDIGAYEFGSRRKGPGSRNPCCPMRPWR